MAIAFDTEAQSSGNTPLTFSHTCTGSDLILFVVSYIDAAPGTTSSVTYNGVGMTQIATNEATSSSGNSISLWYLIAPPTGAHNVVINANSNTVFGFSASYTGAKQSAQPDASIGKDFNTETGQNETLSVTTVVDNCWSIICGRISGAGSTIGAGTGSTQRGTTQSQAGIFDSNGAITPAGSHSMTMTGSATGVTWGAIMASFSPSSQPAVSAVSTGSTLTMMGIG